MKNTKIKNLSLPVLVLLIGGLTAVFYLIFMHSSYNQVTKLDKLMQERVKTQEFQKAKQNGIKNMIVCYGNLNKKGIALLNKVPVHVENNELFENLVIYSNEIEHKENNIIEVKGYTDNIKREIDFNKQVCRIFEIDKL